MAVTGGMRTRLIHDSMLMLVRQGLADLGWLNSGRQHAPINLISKIVDENEAVPPNTISVTFQALLSTEVELGSGLVERASDCWIEFYAESTTVGLHLIRDLQDYLEGRIQLLRSIDYLEVYDFRHASPVKLFNCQFEDFKMEPPARVEKQAYLRHWFAVSLTVIDTQS